MMFNKIIFVCATLALFTLIQADDLSHGGAGTNLEVQKGYSLNGVIDSSGKPAGSVYAYLGGKVSQLPAYPYQYPTTNTDLSQGTTSALWLSQLTSASYFAAGIAAALSLWYVARVALLGVAGSNKNIESSDSNPVKPGGEKGETAGGEKVKSRRRRAIQSKADADLNRLASIVLSAVESGECLQKTICLLGSQMSDKKGKLADTILSSLVPTSVQKSDYYIVLKKSLRGELSCEKFGCPH